MDCSSSGSWNSPGKNTGVGCHFLPQGGIFPTQGSNPGLPPCRQILYQLNHQGSSRDLKGYAVSTLPVLSVKQQKPGWQRICWQHGLLTTLSPPLRPTAQKKKRFLSRYDCLLTRHQVTQELWWRCTRFMSFSCLLIQYTGHRSRTHFDFQVFYFKKYIL